MSWFHKFLTLGVKASTNDEDWFFEEEPHSARRKEILKKYPEIKKLMGYDSTIMYYVIIEVCVQMVMAWLLQDANWTTIVAMAYCFGGVINHSLGSAIHEIGHNLAFGHGRPAYNRLLSLFCNLPMGVPMAITYKKYHADHHRYMGEENQDVDIPTRFESLFFRHPLLKMFWLFVHPVIHSIRPFYKSPKAVTNWEIANFAVQLSFNAVLYCLFGIKSVVYLAAGTALGLGLHPLSGHFISEHYMFTKGQATHSYYGPCNYIMFNLGYHVEHHDFPYVPWNRLPELKRIASEYYDDLPCHSSWTKVVVDFILDRNMGPHARGVGYRKE